ncbi:MAG: CBS domain-containing protein [Myxococcota bacterium]
MALIGSLMKTNMVTAGAAETVAHAALSMARNGVGAVLVLEGEGLVGILSERDVVARVVAEGLDPTATRVADVATAKLVTVDVDTHVRECAKLIREEGIRHLPVLRAGRPEGIVSSRDLFAFVAEGLERVVDEKLYEEALAAGGDPYDHPGGSYGR